MAMKGRTLLDALRRKFKVKTDKALAKHLGISLPSIQTWKDRSHVTIRQVASLVHKASFQSTIVRPIAEFFPISKCKTKGGAAYEVFSVRDEEADIDHPYRDGLRKELLKYHGVYIFFDSRGGALYAGKARRQLLWKELNLAFNRDRGEVQEILRVKHPIRRQPFSLKPRRIERESVALHELARYFSAYQVPDAIIADVEAMLVRSFANDLLNVKMEKFRGGTA